MKHLSVKATMLLLVIVAGFWAHNEHIRKAGKSDALEKRVTFLEEQIASLEKRMDTQEKEHYHLVSMTVDTRPGEIIPPVLVKESDYDREKNRKAGYRTKVWLVPESQRQSPSGSHFPGPPRQK